MASDQIGKMTTIKQHLCSPFYQLCPFLLRNDGMIIPQLQVECSELIQALIQPLIICCWWLIYCHVYHKVWCVIIATCRWRGLAVVAGTQPWLSRTLKGHQTLLQNYSYFVPNSLDLPYKRLMGVLLVNIYYSESDGLLRRVWYLLMLCLHCCSFWCVGMPPGGCLWPMLTTIRAGRAGGVGAVTLEVIHCSLQGAPARTPATPAPADAATAAHLAPCLRGSWRRSPEGLGGQQPHGSDGRPTWHQHRVGPGYGPGSWGYLGQHWANCQLSSFTCDKSVEAVGWQVTTVTCAQILAEDDTGNFRQYVHSQLKHAIRHGEI